MSDFEEKLNRILGDPGAMEQIAGMAKSLMGTQNATESEPAPKQKSAEDTDWFSPAMLGKLGSVMQTMEGKDDKQALLTAMKPYLSSKRREKLERAMKLAKMIHMAELAFGMFGGERNAKI